MRRLNLTYYLTTWWLLDGRGRLSRLEPRITLIYRNTHTYGHNNSHIHPHDPVTCGYPCYACIAEPPHIHPFTIGDGYHEGGRVGWQCFITKGDGPLTIEWLKNNQSLDLTSTPSLSVTYQNEYSSSVLIESIRLAHEGNYTCRATNPVATVEHTVTLTVLGTYSRQRAHTTFTRAHCVHVYCCFCSFCCCCRRRLR